MRDELIPSNMVMVTKLRYAVDLDILFKLLPVVNIYDKHGKIVRYKDDKIVRIPYFGIEKIILCAGYKKKTRGIRQRGGLMKNVVSIDLQCFDKNIHVKIGKNKIQLTGALSEEMGIGTFNIVLEHFRMLQSHLNYIKSLSEDDKFSTREYILDTRYRGLKSSSFSPDPHFYDFLDMYIHEYITEEEFLENFKSITLISAKEFDFGNPEQEIYETKIHNGVYNFRFVKQINLIGFVKFLHSRNFMVSFHNWNSCDIQLVIPAEEDQSTSFDSFASPSTDDEDEGPEKYHRITIYKRSVRMSSPTGYSESYKIYSLLRDLYSEFSEII